ncbi:MAG: DUF1992 domain-containing protein [Myxococcota bacterium]|nr:DUF1992 domain-containing protein [Myxococcota bacterium]
MGFWQDLVEARIAEARAKGLFANLRGRGRPAAPDELAGLPAEARAVARIAASCGGAPPEVDRMRDADRLRREIAALAPGPERDAKQRALRNLEIELALLLERSGRAILLAPPPERLEDDDEREP